MLRATGEVLNRRVAADIIGYQEQFTPQGMFWRSPDQRYIRQLPDFLAGEAWHEVNAGLEHLRLVELVESAFDRSLPELNTAVTRVAVLRFAVNQRRLSCRLRHQENEALRTLGIMATFSAAPIPTLQQGIQQALSSLSPGDRLLVLDDLRYGYSPLAQPLAVSLSYLLPDELQEAITLLTQRGFWAEILLLAPFGPARRILTIRSLHG